jgi:hypothetical protein
MLKWDQNELYQAHQNIEIFGELRKAMLIKFNEYYSFTKYKNKKIKNPENEYLNRIMKVDK